MAVKVLEPDGRMAPLSLGQSIIVLEPSKAVGDQVLTPGDSHTPQSHNVLTRLVRNICSRQPSENILTLKHLKLDLLKFIFPNKISKLHDFAILSRSV